jgi:hypothetical protein
MSINSLTDLEMQRQMVSRPSVVPLGTRPTDMDVVPPSLSRKEEVSPSRDSQVSNALELLTKYIPTEVITLYVAAVSVVQILPNKEQIAPIVYWSAAVLTPVFLVLVLMSKQAAAGQSPIPGSWPW